MSPCKLKTQLAHIASMRDKNGDVPIDRIKNIYGLDKEAAEKLVAAGEEVVKSMTKAYLDYKNNFLTVERWAEYYDIPLHEAGAFLRYSRDLHEAPVTQS